MKSLDGYYIRNEKNQNKQEFVLVTPFKKTFSSVYHGVMNTRENGFINIGSEIEDDAIIIYVEDNGKRQKP